MWPRPGPRTDVSAERRPLAERAARLHSGAGSALHDIAPRNSPQTPAAWRHRPEAVAAARKIVADAISAAFFHFLCCIDAVGTPRSYEDPWLPVTLHMPVNESEDEPKDLNMYHSAFFDAYWDWRDLRPDPGWKLDNSLSSFDTSG